MSGSDSGTSRSEKEIRRDQGPSDGPTSTGESVSDDLKALIREDLKESWNSTVDRGFRMTTKARWTSVDSRRMVLEDPAGSISTGNLHCIYNKPTSMYWMQSGQITNNCGEKNGIPGIVFGAIHETWNECYDFKGCIAFIDNFKELGVPEVEYTHFLANPVKITTTGPSTIRSIVNAHLSIYEQAASYLHQVKCGIIKQHWLNSWWTEEEDPSTVQLQHYFLYPLLRAVILIMDRIDDEIYTISKESDGMTSLSKVAKCQTILIVRTGIEEGLSGPISFESLTPSSLPIGRCREDLDLVGVSLDVAVRFIVDLEKREASANPNVSLVERRSSYGKRATAWAEQEMAKAEEVGYHNYRETRESIERVKARMAGEEYWMSEPMALAPTWKYP